MNSLAKTTDADFLSSLPSRVRREVLELERIFESIALAKSESAGLKAAAKVHGHKRGYSYSNLRKKYYEFKRLGVPALVDKAKLGTKNAAINVGDIFRGYCEQNQRSSREAYRTMMRDLRNGKHLADLGTWRDVFASEFPDRPTPHNCPMDYTPRGWSYANLMKCAGLSAYEIVATRVGRGKAKDYLPSVYSTRNGLRVGQIYMFDDMWHDAKVNYPGNMRAQRMIELAAVDVFSANRFAYGIEPRKENLETGKMHNLNETHMRQLLAHVMINVGYHPEGCTMIVEHGTAAASGDLESIIRNLSNGVITFERSGMLSAPVHKGLFCGQPKGNPKRKAALESQHSLCHTVAAALAGQIGKDRDHSPEQMYGLEQYNNQLIKAAAALPPERAKLLMLPLLDFNTYKAAIADLYREMNFRCEHDLEGWEAAGLVTTEYRLSPTTNEWMPATWLLDQPADQQLVLYNAIQTMPELSRVRKLSPAEVFNAGTSELIRLPKSSMPLILGERLAVEKELHDDGLFRFQNQAYGPGEFRYLARSVTDIHGFKIPLVPRRNYVIHINPFNLEECFVSELDRHENNLPVPGAYIGLAQRWQTVCKDDSEALQKQAGKQAHIEAVLRAPIARRGQKVIAAKKEMHENNTDVFAQESGKLEFVTAKPRAVEPDQNFDPLEYYADQPEED